MQIDSRQIHRSCIQYIRIRSLCQLQLIVNAAGRKICSVDIPAKNCRIGKEKAAIHIGRQICRMVAEQLRDRHHLFLVKGRFLIDCTDLSRRCAQQPGLFYRQNFAFQSAHRNILQIILERQTLFCSCRRADRANRTCSTKVNGKLIIYCRLR